MSRRPAQIDKARRVAYCSPHTTRGPMRLLSDDELHALRPSETAAFPGPIPTQIVSSDEFVPLPYADLGQIFAQSTVADPRLCAAMMGQLVQGLCADRVVWGTDAVWTGSPQWQ